MTDRPIIFSSPMVRALLDGSKTQTRRLATSPLILCGAGDRLWVRERGWISESGDAFLPFAGNEKASPSSPSGAAYRSRPSIFMPRWASRLTLIVENVRVESLQAISASDARAEGHPRSSHDLPQDVHDDAARDWYMDLWDDLHRAAGERWRDNPPVVALTFRVERANVDAPGGAV